MFAAATSLSVQNRRGATSQRHAFGSDRAPAAVGAACRCGYLSGDAGDERHLPPPLPTVHRVATSGGLSALSHHRRSVSAGKWNGRTGTKDVCVGRWQAWMTENLLSIRQLEPDTPTQKRWRNRKRHWHQPIRRQYVDASLSLLLWCGGELDIRGFTLVPSSGSYGELHRWNGKDQTIPQKMCSSGPAPSLPSCLTPSTISI